MCRDLFHPCSTLFHQFGATRSAYGPKRPFLAVLDALGALWHTHIALPDPQNCSNSSLGMCRDLFHPCFTLFHQFGATRLAYGQKRPFLAFLDPVWPYIWPKWLEQECSPLEQVNPYQNKAENIIGCHGKPTSKNPPSLTQCARKMGGGVYPCPNFLALFLEVHFWSIKRVYFFKNANVLNF